MEPNTQQILQRNRVLTIAMFAVLIALFITLVNKPRTGEVKPSISVTGSAEVTAVPDTATISFSVIETAKTVEVAQKQATERMNKALTYLKSVGVDEKDIKTSNYSVNPQYEYKNVTCFRAPCESSQVLVGYQAVQGVEVKVRKTDQAGTIIGGLGTAGVQNIYGPNFGFDDDTKIQDQAREKAIANAKAKAEVLAKQLGVRLGKVSSFSETLGGFPIAYAAKMDAVSSQGSAAPVPELPTGQNKVTSSVTITYEIY